MRRLLMLTLLTAVPALTHAASNQIVIKTANTLPIARPGQTIELTALQLVPLGSNELNRIHVKDSTGHDLLCQAVDSDGNGTVDQVIFQTDFASHETKTFTVTVGKKWEYTKEQFKAYGRFVRERFDDFAWENDRVAHRTYGKALETWAKEPLTSSTIDIWSKRTTGLVVNDWYLTDHYHSDAGAGADFYSAGLSRGCGGNGLWAADRLWVSRNFVQSRVLANGPIRVMFELTYEPFDVNGVSVGEVKRITLDAGQYLSHYRIFYQPFTKPEKTVAFTMAAGLKKVNGEQVELNTTRGWLAKWELMEKNAGHQGLAIVFDPSLLEKQIEDKLNVLVLMKVPENNQTSYRAGFFWDKAGQFANFDAWKAYVDQVAQGLAAPIEVSVSAE